jgi:hypothetical protein
VTKPLADRNAFQKAMMMPSLAEYLHSFAESYSRKAPQLETELRQIETRKREIENQLYAARLTVSGTMVSCISSICFAWVKRLAHNHNVEICKNTVQLF